jgi:hypothetical protein
MNASLLESPYFDHAAILGYFFMNNGLFTSSWCKHDAASKSWPEPWKISGACCRFPPPLCLAALA